MDARNQALELIGEAEDAARRMDEPLTPWHRFGDPCKCYQTSEQPNTSPPEELRRPLGAITRRRTSPPHQAHLPETSIMMHAVFMKRGVIRSVGVWPGMPCGGEWEEILAAIHETRR